MVILWYLLELFLHWDVLYYAGIAFFDEALTILMKMMLWGVFQMFDVGVFFQHQHQLVVVWVESYLGVRRPWVDSLH